MKTYIYNVTYPRVDKITADWMPEFEISQTKFFLTHFRICSLWKTGAFEYIVCVYLSITKLDGNVDIHTSVDLHSCRDTNIYVFTWLYQFFTRA